jgi:hypothetical protein
MGQPEDYRLDDEGESITLNRLCTNAKSKKLYRDEANGMIGGV